MWAGVAQADGAFEGGHLGTGFTQRRNDRDGRKRRHEFLRVPILRRTAGTAVPTLVEIRRSWTAVTLLLGVGLRSGLGVFATLGIGWGCAFLGLLFLDDFGLLDFGGGGLDDFFLRREDA